MTDIQYILNTFLLLMSGALVFWMAAGFSMLEAGLVRTKNTTAILTKNICLYSLSCLTFFAIGYQVMYGAISDGDHSGASDFFFQVVFVATAASIISGVIAERMKFWSFMIFVAVLSAMAGVTNNLQNYIDEIVANNSSDSDLILTSGEQVSVGLLSIILK